MKQVEQVVIVLGVLLLSGGGIQAVDSDGRDNPYRSIVERNPFGLKPATVAPRADTLPPPPQIILNGMTAASGHKRALFKTQDRLSLPGSVVEKNYILAEGQQDDGIQLLRVDMSTDTIKVNNRGVIQEIALCATPKIGVPAAARTGVPAHAVNDADGSRPATARIGQAPDAEARGLAQGRPGPTGIGGGSSDPGNDSSADNGTPPSDSDTGGSPSGGKDSVQGYHWWVKEAQRVEQARQATAQQVINGTLQPFPLTPFTPPGTPANLIGPNKAYFFFDPTA